MTATAGSPSVTAPSPARPAARETGPGRGTTQQPATARTRAPAGRTILRTAVSVAIVAAIFGFALPRFASYRSVYASMHAMTWPQVLPVTAAAVASMAATWLTI